MGEWMFASFRATELRNILVFIKAQNNEDILRTWFSSKEQEYSEPLAKVSFASC